MLMIFLSVKCFTLMRTKYKLKTEISAKVNKRLDVYKK